MRSIKTCALALAILFGAATPALALDFEVDDNTSDPDDDAPADDNVCETAAGTCSLRAAIEEANERTGPHNITFASNVMAINLTAELPDIRAEINIDGTNAGAPGGRVDINGGAVDGVGGLDCFDFISSGTVQADTPDPNDYAINNEFGGQGSTITNLVIRNCADDGIVADGHGYSFITNRIGTDPLGTEAEENDGDGIRITGTRPPLNIPDISAILDDPLSNVAAIVAFAAALEAALTIVAEPNFITGNLISGNLQNGIELNNDMTTNTHIAGNIIGLSANSLVAIPNGTGGGAPAAVDFNAGAYGNMFGPGNIVSGNANNGIHFSGAVILPNFIMGNLVGVGGLPALELGNGEHGIEIDTTRDVDGSGMNNPVNQTPYTAFIGPANIVSDNKSDNGGALDVYGTDDSGGISIDGEGVRIFGNAIGMWAFPAGLDLSAIGIQDPLIDVGNSGNGIVLNTSGHMVGGAEVFEANFILHNERHGILVKGSSTVGNRIQGNFIGVAPPTGLDIFELGNRGNGIVVHTASGTIIGGTDPEEDNVIAGNGLNGIALRGGATDNGWSNLIQRNQIYGNGVTTPGEGIAVDLEGDCSPPTDVPGCNDPDPFPDPAGDDPNAQYANKGQNRPVICTALDTPVVGCTAPSFNAMGGATSTRWTIETRPMSTLRIEHFSLRPDGMTFLYDETVTTDVNGLPTGGSCSGGFCTSTGTPSTPTDTRGQSIVMTATDLFPIDVPPVGVGVDSPANNTSEYSEGAAIPQELAFSSATFPAGEAAGTTNITVQRLGEPLGAVSVDVVVVAGGTATGGGIDFDLVTVNPLTWADGDGTPKTFTVSINDDSLDENNETVNFELQNPTGAIEGTPNAATLTIIDNDDPPTIALGDGNVTETNAAQPMQFTATLSTASSFNVDVSYTTSNATAIAPGDYTAATAVIATIPAGSLSVNFDINIAGDLLDENTETFNLTATASNTTALGSDLAAVGTIQDDDPMPVVSINDVGPTNEGNGPGTTPFDFTVSTNVASGLPVTVRVTSFVAGDTATAPSDYVAVNQLVTIPAGSTSAPLTVNVVGDTTFEAAPTEFFSLTIAADGVQPINATIGDGTGIGTITNDDASPGTLQFTPDPADQIVAENVGTATFTVTRTGGTGGAVSTTVTLGGDATIGVGNDYTTSSLVLNWADGDATPQTITVTVNDDVGQEAAETVTFTLGAPTGGATLGVPAAATLTIQANDAPAGSLQFTPNPADQTVAETIGTATFTVTRTGGTAGAVSTTVTLGGTATIGVGNDYTTTALTLNWADGDATPQTITVTVNDDVAPEADETVTLTLGAPTGGATLGVPAAATLTIQANDASAGTLQFTPDPANQSVAENVGTATFTVTRAGGTAGAVSTTVALGGTATIGVGNDYTASALTLNWADGDATPQTVMIAVNDDVAPEGDETVTLTLGAPTGGATLSVPDNATLTILANDAAAGTLQFTPNPADQSVNENVGTATFTVTRTGGSAGEVSTTVALGGTATEGVGNDYTTSGLVLTWTAGDTSDRTITVTVNDDPTPEGAETVTMTLGTFTGGATGGVPGSATLTIAASDAPAGTLQFTPNPADQNVAENVGMTSFTVSRTGGSTGAVSTTVALGGTATIGVGNDYTTGALLLNWADGDTTDRTVVITVNDDVAEEVAETVTLTLGNFTGGATAGAPSVATLTIAANDAAAGTLQFTPNPADQTVAENVGTATFTVTRAGGTAGAISTTVALGGTATIGVGNDYTTSALVLNWADGDATDRTVVVTVNDDAAPEGNETVTLTLGAPTGGASLGTPSLATLTISANDASAGTLQFTPNPADQTVNENVGTATFTVTRTGGTAGAVSTTVALGGTATIGAGNDYTTGALLLSWADNDATSRTVVVTVNDDVAQEGAETVTLTLGAPTGGAVLGTPTLATLTIAANDAAAGSLQFTPNPADQSVAENAGTASFTVTRTGGSAGAVSATVMVGGTATQGVGNDYTVAPTTLNWADGDATDRTVVVTINDDATPEANETVAMTLSAPTGGAVIGTPATATLTIAANDAAAGSVQFGAGSVALSIGEAGGTIGFTVSRTGGSAGAVSVNVTLGGTALSPADFTAAPLTLNWADGDVADKTVTFTIADDAAIEGNETVTLTLTAPGGGVAVGVPAAGTLTIVDNDGVVVPQLSAPLTIPSTSTWSLLAMLLAMFTLAGLAQAKARRN